MARSAGSRDLPVQFACSIMMLRRECNCASMSTASNTIRCLYDSEPARCFPSKSKIFSSRFSRNCRSRRKAMQDFHARQVIEYKRSAATILTFTPQPHFMILYDFAMTQDTSTPLYGEGRRELRCRQQANDSPARLPIPSISATNTSLSSLTMRRWLTDENARKFHVSCRFRHFAICSLLFIGLTFMRR